VAQWNQLGNGATLGPEIRSPYERSYGHDFSTVRIHDDARAVELSTLVGARAFTLGSHIVFGSKFRPEAPQSQKILAHELAHVAQQAKQSSAPPALPRRSLKVSTFYSSGELEAERAARAALRGEPFRSFSPPQADVMTFPWLLLGAALLITGAVLLAAPSTEENRRAAEADRERLINTGWVFVPGVGSFLQVWQARSGFERGVGAVFLVADIVTLGMAGAAFLKLSQAGIAGLRTASGSTVRELTQAGMRSVTEAEANTAIHTALQSGQAVVASEGVLNHAVIYVMNEQGQIIRLHGGISRLLYPAQTFTAETFRTSAVNSFFVVGQQGANVTLLEAASQLRQGGAWMLRSCGATQCLLLERAGISGLSLPATYSGRYIPASIMAHQAIHSGGATMVNATRFWTGTAIQGSLLAGSSSALHTEATLPIFLTQPQPVTIRDASIRPTSTAPGPGGRPPVGSIHDRVRRIRERYGADPQGMTLTFLLRGLFEEFFIPFDPRYFSRPEVLQETEMALVTEGFSAPAAQAILRRLHELSAR
jgi:hypothetical protein